MIANPRTHTHCQVAQKTNPTSQNLSKSMVAPTLQTEREKLKKGITMYIKNRRNSNKTKAFGSYQTLCLTESFVLRNRLLFKIC